MLKYKIDILEELKEKGYTSNKNKRTWRKNICVQQ